jgi:hypothetical protein
MTTINELFYAGTVNVSGFPYVFRTESERDEWVAENDGFVIPTASVDPELRREDAHRFDAASL